jgi:hypothetical protein
MNKNYKNEPRIFWIFHRTEERGGDGMVKPSVVLTLCLRLHQRREYVLHIQKKILWHRDLEARGVIRPNGSRSLRNLLCCEIGVL